MSSPNPYNDPALQESLADTQLSQSTLLQTKQLHRTSANETLISQREREIEDIATGIIELANIFQELQTMVIDQGSMLDRIDYNVESMAKDVKEADKELKVASGYQRKTVKRKIMLLLVILIVGMVILLSLKLGNRKSGSGGGKPNPVVTEPPEAPEDGDGVGIRGSERRSSSRPPIVFRPSREWRRRKRRIWNPRAEGGLALVGV